MGTANARRSKETTTGAWTCFAIFAGGPDRLDAVLERAVDPALSDLRGDDALERWYFVRWVDPRGPHLRLELRGDRERLEPIAERIRDTMGGLDEVPVRKPLLPRPASQRQTGGELGVEPIGHHPEEERFGDGLAVAERLFEASSETVLAALPGLRSGRERAAFGLSLMGRHAELALEPAARAALWEDVVSGWTGEDERGRRLRDRLIAQAADLGRELIEVSRGLSVEGITAAAYERYSKAYEQMLEQASGASLPELARHHAHLTSNRLGVTPLEEALLGSILASAPQPRQAGDRRKAATEAVRLEQVCKQDGERLLLDDISLSIHEGEVFGLLGPQGAGKSSLLGIAAGLRVATSGSVRVFGVDPSVERRRLTQTVALGLPDEELVEESTVRENLELEARAAGGGSVDEVLEAIRLRERSAAPVSDLAPGERRRLAVGCALIRAPRVLLLDEPTAGLSPVEREALWELIAERSRQGTTVLLATTSLQETCSVCHRAGLLLDGSLTAVGDPEEIAGEHFPERSVHFQTAEEPDAALLSDLPEVRSVKVDQRVDHWALEVQTLQPDELLKALGSDPDFPRIISVAEEDLEGTFLRSGAAAPDEARGHA